VIFVSFLAFDTKFGLFEKLMQMFLSFVSYVCIFTLIHTLSTRGRRGELHEKFRKFGSLHPHVQGELAFVQGELSCCFQCGVCALLGL
jgi:hypothetical protein